MHFKRTTKALLALMLACLMILSSCAKKDSPPVDTTPPPSSDGNQSGGGDQSGDGGGACQHENFVLANAKAATCTEDGYSGDKTCSDCGELIQGQVVAKLGHANDAGVVTKIATCVQTGVKTYTCTRCLLETTETLAQLDSHSNEYHYVSDDGHTMVCMHCQTSSSGAHTQSELVESVAATCTEGAYSLYLCSDCDGEYKVYDTLQLAKDHSWDTQNPVTTPATCISEGSSYLVCLNCGDHGSTQTLPATPNVHAYRVISTVSASCKAEGEEVSKCDLCATTATKVLPKILHTYGPAQTEGSWTHQTCTSCGHKVSTFDATADTKATVNPTEIANEQAFEVKLQGGTKIEFPSSVVDTMKNAGGDMTISADVVADKETLLAGIDESIMSADDKNALLASGASIYDFGVAGINTSRFAGKVTVTLPYTLANGEEAEGIVIWYITDSGEIQAVDNVLFIDDNGDGIGEVIFEVEHFSHYAVAYKETAEMRCRRGHHDYGNEDRWISVSASCTSHGYTLKVCSVCGDTNITDLKNPIGHSYGAKQEPVVDCENGGYVYDECANCHDIRTYEYKFANGHTPDGHATCDTSVTCSVCRKVIVAAYGHSWSDWNIVVEAANGTEGLKRRNCPRCGATETMKIAPLTDISAWEYNSLSELLEVIFTEVIGVNNGHVTVNLPYDGDAYMVLDGMVNISGDSYTAVLDVTLDEETGTLYYIDGRCVVESPDGSRMLADIDKLLPYTFDEYMESAKVYFRESDEMLAKSFDAVNSFVAIINSAYGEKLDSVFAENGIEFTCAELADVLELEQTLYAYYCIKLGFETSVSLELEPDGKYIDDVLGLLMEAEDVDGGHKYTYDFADVYAAIDTAIKYLEDREATTFADFIYELVGDTVKATYPSAADFDGLVSLIKEKFGGNVQVKTVVDSIAAAIAASGEYTIDDLYEVIENYAVAMGESIDIKAQIEEFAEMTMDELIQNIVDDDEATAAEFYDALAAELKELTLGECIVDSTYSEEWKDDHWETTVIDITLSEALDSARASIGALTVVGNIQITVTDNGKIGGINFALSLTQGTGEDAVTLEYEATVSESNEQIVIPADIRALTDNRVSFSYDANGNLTISGIPADADATVSVSGSVDAKLDDLVTLDTALSSELGFDVYVLKREYWDNRVDLGDYLIDSEGNLYTGLTNYHRHPSQVIEKEKINTVLASPESYLPQSGEEPVGYYRLSGESRLPIYSTLFGYVYQENGEWQLIDKSSTYYYFSEDENGERVIVFDRVVSAPYTAATASIVISNLQTERYTTVVDTDGQTALYAGTMYVEMEGFEDNVGLDVVIIGSDVYFVALSEYSEERIYEVGDPIDTSIVYDGMYDYDNDTVIYKDGQVTEDYSVVWLYRYIPTYYAYYDGYYFVLNNSGYDSLIINSTPFGEANVTGLPTVTLPDGRTLYEIGREGDITYEGKIYGYISVGNGLYVHACASYEDSALKSIAYRASVNAWSECARKYMNLYSNELNQLAEGYITKNADGTYTVSAEGIALLKSLCSSEEDYVAIYVRGTFANGEASTSFDYYEPLAYVVPTSTYSYSSNYVDWTKWFGENTGVAPEDGIYSYFTITSNDDGSITITSKNGENLYVDFYFDTNQNITDAEKFLTKNEELSAEYGVDVYTSVSTYENYNAYVYFGGAYYHLDTTYKYYVEDYKTVADVREQLNRYTIGELSYQFDEIDEISGESIARVYRGSLYLENGSSIGCYFKLVDGSLHVLTGVEHIGNTQISFEDSMPLDEYVASLTISFAYDYGRDRLSFHDGTPVYCECFYVYEGEQLLSSIECYYYLDNGSKVYFILGSTSQEYTYSFSEQVTLPEGWIETDRYTEVNQNRTLEIVSGFYYVTRENQSFVKVGDKYIYLYEYLNKIYSEDSFLWSFGDHTYLAGVDTGDGVVYYSGWNYGSWDELYDNFIIELYETADITDFLGVIQSGGVIGYDENGNPVYEYTAFRLDSADVYTLSNGEKMYCFEGTTEGFVKLADGSYLHGYLEQNGDGSYEFNIFAEVYYNPTFSSDEFVGSLGLIDYITFNGTSITIDEGIYEKLLLCENYWNYIYILGYRVEFTEFMALFETSVNQ